MYDVMIIGSGPSGLAAGIYAQRAGLNTIVIEKSFMSGGQVLNTYEVDNYPGLPEISGMDMSMKFRDHVEKLGCQFVQEEVKEVSIEGMEKKIVTQKNEYVGKTIILATGARHRKLEVPGEQEFMGKGVSYCATCDGAFFQDKVVAVVGGGDVALEDAIFLARKSKKVYLIHRRDAFRGAKILQNKIKEYPNIEVIWNHTVKEIKGDEVVTQVVLSHTIGNAEMTLDLDGVFVAVGILPNSELLKDKVDMDKGGYIEADETCRTSEEGVFVAGDARTKSLRQIITAAADGANAITSVTEYLNK